MKPSEQENFRISSLGFRLTFFVYFCISISEIQIFVTHCYFHSFHRRALLEARTVFARFFYFIAIVRKSMDKNRRQRERNKNGV